MHDKAFALTVPTNWFYFDYAFTIKHSRYMDVMNVLVYWQKVLQSHPTYPKIKKEILDKARSMVRVAGTSSKSG